MKPTYIFFGHCPKCDARVVGFVSDDRLVAKEELTEMIKRHLRIVRLQDEHLRDYPIESCKCPSGKELFPDIFE